MDKFPLSEKVLFEFFKNEPRKTDSNVAWSCNYSEYEVEDGSHTLIFGIQPNVNFIRILLKHAESELYKLEAYYDEVNIMKGSSQSSVLEFDINAEEKLLLCLPNIKVHHSYSRDDDEQFNGVLE